MILKTQTKLNKYPKQANISTLVKFPKKARKPGFHLQCISEMQPLHGETFCVSPSQQLQGRACALRGCSCCYSRDKALEEGAGAWFLCVPQFHPCVIGFAFETAINHQGNEEAAEFGMAKEDESNPKKGCECTDYSWLGSVVWGWCCFPGARQCCTNTIPHQQNVQAWRYFRAGRAATLARCNRE